MTMMSRRMMISQLRETRWRNRHRTCEKHPVSTPASHWLSRRSKAGQSDVLQCTAILSHGVGKHRGINPSKVVINLR